MPDYQKAKIYVIRAPGTDDVYIGSTTKALSARMASHKCLYKKWKEGTTNKTSSFPLIEKEGCYIELVENFPCNSKEELNKREGEIIRSTPAAINRCVAGRTTQEYKEENKDHLAEKSKEWRENNRDRVNENNRKWREANPDKYKESKRKCLEKKRSQKVE